MSDDETKAPLPPLEPSLNDPELAARRRKRLARRIALRWVKRALLGAAVVGIGWLVVSAWLPKPAVVDVGVIRRARLQVFLEEDGRTRVKERYLVAAPISGNLARIELEPGAVLRAGAAVAHIAPPAPAMLDAQNRAEAEARLVAANARERQAHAALARAEAARGLAEREAMRVARLAAQGVATEAERDLL